MRLPSGAIGGLLILLATPASAAVVVGQIDTFEDGTTEGWTTAIGPTGAIHPAPPSNVSSGGPDGLDDNYLLLSSLGGFGPGSRLTVLNFSQWSGDYLAAGIGAISMSLNNFGNDELYLRLLFEDPMGAPPTNVAFSTNPVVLLPGSGWQNFLFPVNPGALTAPIGSAEAALSQTTILRIYHSAAPEVPGDPIVAQLGVDNIQALAAVPEPGTWAMMVLGFAFVGGAFRVTKRRQKPTDYYV
jgi:hypothetical protein